MVDRAIRESNEARREAEAHRADLGVEVARRLDAEEVSVGLRTDLAEARGLLQVEGDEYDRLSSTVLAVCDDLRGDARGGGWFPRGPCCWYHSARGPA